MLGMCNLNRLSAVQKRVKANKTKPSLYSKLLQFSLTALPKVIEVVVVVVGVVVGVLFI